MKNKGKKRNKRRLQVWDTNKQVMRISIQNLNGNFVGFVSTHAKLGAIWKTANEVKKIEMIIISLCTGWSFVEHLDM